MKGELLIMSLQPDRLLTPEEYLAIERKAEYKSEYFAGEMFALAGANRRHNRIVTNVVVGIDTQLKERPCNVYSSDMRVKVVKTGLYTYPDVVVTCGEELFEDDHKDTLLNPIVIIEVLSESTEAYDRGKKFKHYQQIESLLEYLLVAQDSYGVEKYVRQTGKQWLYSEFHDPEEIIKVQSIGCELVLKDLYSKVE